MTRIPGKPSLSVVIVSWESGADLVECVRSLAGACSVVDPSPELIVVDNASREFPAAEIAATWAGATLIRNETNRGFGPAANQGVAAARSTVILFLNPDTRAVDDPFTPLLQRCRSIRRRWPSPRGCSRANLPGAKTSASTSSAASPPSDTSPGRCSSSTGRFPATAGSSGTGTWTGTRSNRSKWSSLPRRRWRCGAKPSSA